MKKQLTLMIMATFSLLTAQAVEPEITIGTNTFGFVFEDSMLATNVKMRIKEDFEVLMQAWTNVVVTSYHLNTDFAGHLIFEDTVGGPDFGNGPELGADFNIKKLQNKRYIYLTQTNCTVYATAFELIDGHQTEYAKVTELLSALQYENLMNMSSNDFKNIYYYHGTPIENYALGMPEVLPELASRNYYPPSVLSFELNSAGYLTHPTEALWVWIPMRTRPDAEEGWDTTVTYIPAIYIDGKWKIHPLIF